MRPVIPWRSRVALWLLLPAVACVYAFCGLYFNLSSVRGYWPAVVAGSAIFLFFPCAVASVSAAHEGARARRGRLSTVPHARREVELVATALWPSLACAAAVQLAAVLILGRGTWATTATDPLTLIRLGGAFVAILVLHTAMGYLLGRHLPLAVSIPVALLLSYSWLGFTWSVNWFPLRYLSGLVLADCCSVDTVLDARAPLAAIVFSLGMGLLLIAVAVIRTPESTARLVVRWASAAAAASAVTVASILIAADLGYSPAVARPAAEATCDGTAPVVCLYPEVRGTGAAEDTIRRAVRNLESAGLPVPSTVRMGDDARTDDTLSMVVTVGMTDAQVIHSLAVSFLPLSGAPACGTAADLQQRQGTYSTVGAWIVHVAAQGIVDPASVQPASSGEPGAYDDLARLDARRQLAWVHGALHALQDCSVAPLPVTAS
jgi:hypothetical protein